MTKWKQPSNGITAVMVPSGSFRALPLHLLSGGVSSLRGSLTALCVSLLETVSLR